MANDRQAMCDFWIVILMIGAAAGIFRASFVFFLGPSPYGETVSGNTLMIIIFILIIGFGCYMLSGGFESKPKSSGFESKQIKSEYSKKRRCPHCGKKIKKKAVRCKYCKTMLKTYYKSETDSNAYGPKHCPHCNHTISPLATRCPFCKKKI